MAGRVRLLFVTDDEAQLLLEYRGLVHATEAFERAVAQDTPNDWNAQYMRAALSSTTSRTATPDCRLTRSLFVARGRRRRAKEHNCEVSRRRFNELAGLFKGANRDSRRERIVRSTWPRKVVGRSRGRAVTADGRPRPDGIARSSRARPQR
jgi:hypothetical protein